MFIKESEKNFSDSRRRYIEYQYKTKLYSIISALFSYWLFSSLVNLLFVSRFHYQTLQTMKTSFVTFICVVAVALVVALPKRPQKLGAVSTTLQPIGEIDGKMYYLENVQLSWQGSLQHCSNSNRMNLASITTRHQMDFLIQAFNNMTGDFWTSGRDARAPRQYVFNHTGETMDPAVINFVSSPYYQTCLVLRAAPNNGSKIHGVHCETNRLQPICEQNIFP